MIPRALLRFVPLGALAFGVIAFAVLLRFAVHRGVGRRRVLLVAMIAGATPALYVGLTWASLLGDAHVRIARPWGTLLALAATSFIAVRLAGKTTRQSAWRVRLGDLYAETAALAAALAVAGPEVGRALDRLTILVAVDRSRSIDLVPNADQRIGQELSIAELGMRDDDRIGTIAFGADAAIEDPPRPRGALPSPQRAAVGRDGTDLAAAIRRAMAEVPADSAARVVLVTDGVATRGDTMSAAATALAAGVPVDVLPLEQRAVPDVRVVTVRAPTRADEGEAMDLRVVTSSPAPCRIEIRMSRDGKLVARTEAAIGAGEDVLRIREKAPAPGLHRYDVEVTALDPGMDQTPDDNSGSTFVRVRGTAAALVLEGDAGKGAFLAHALESAAFHVDQGGANAVPTDLGAFAAYDLLVLSDIRAADLSPGQIEAVASYVRDLGGGLILMGGDRSLGPGGYGKTAIEEVSPVSFDLKQDRRRGSLAEVIGIDISGSMGAEVSGHTKLELANEAAARSADLLGPGDFLGVEHVDTSVTWSVPLSPVSDKTAIAHAIRSVGAGGGGIYVDITLDAAYAELDKQQVNLKHVLLFADGSDAEQMTGCEAKVSAAQRRGITTSVIALGDGSDVPELEVLSRLGGGRFYLIEDATRLPAVFSQETILAARSAIVEKHFSVSRGAPGSDTAGIPFAEAPELRGYVVTIPKSRASVLLNGPDGDPILAVWSAGVGRSAVFTSDLKDRWGAEWTAWPGAARMIAQVARDVTRKAEDEKVRLESDATGGELHIRANVVGDDGRTQSFRRLMVHVAGPDGFSREMALEAAGAGAYAGAIPLSRPGTYIAVARDELSGDAVGTTGAALTAGEELRPTGSDLALLARVAELTSGKKRDTLAGIFGDRASKRFAYKDATPTLAALAAIALLLAVAARRLAIPDALLGLPARLRASWRGRPLRSETSPNAAPPDVVSSLLQARERGRARVPQAPMHADKEARLRTPAPIAQPLAATSQAPHPSGLRAPNDTAAPARATEPRAQPTPPARPKSAAEILVERRRGKR